MRGRGGGVIRRRLGIGMMHDETSEDFVMG